MTTYLCLGWACNPAASGPASPSSCEVQLQQMGCPHFLVATLILCGMPAAFTQRQDIVAGAILGRAADSFSTILDGGCCCSCFYWSRTASPSTAASRVLTTPHCFHKNVKRSISQPASHMLLCWGWFLGIQAPDASKLQLCRMQQHASIPQNPMHTSRCFFHPMWLSHMQILPPVHCSEWELGLQSHTAASK